MNVVGHNVVVIRKFLVTDGALPVLLDNFAVQQLPHFCRRAEFAKSSGVVRIVNALNTKAPGRFYSALFMATAEARAVDRTVLVSAEFHRQRSSAAFGQDQ